MILNSPFSQPVRIEIKGSPMVAGVIVAPLLLLAITVLFYTPLAWYVLVLPLAALLMVGAYYLRVHYWQLGKCSALEINQDNDQQWAVLTSDKWHLVELQPNSFVSPWLIVLNFKGDSGCYTVMLPADSLDKDTHRRLRVRVRMAFS
ncbi:MAG: hypothetical protein CSB47_07065 [Proteobacteria bacterium]|nr:MAG: hypothetical protein CSB47_07065 [Pseudomonadota bacterium]